MNKQIIRKYAAEHIDGTIMFFETAAEVIAMISEGWVAYLW